MSTSIKKKNYEAHKKLRKEGANKETDNKTAVEHPPNNIYIGPGKTSSKLPKT